MPKRRKPSSNEKVAVNNLVVISDLHSGCRLALAPPEGCSLDDGGTYMPSRFQLKLWSFWEYFWQSFVPEATKGEPFAVLCNGDAIDGVHHNSTTQISHNLEDQGELAYRLLKPVVEACEGRYYHVRGTEAHVGKSAVEEERLAKRLGAIPNQDRQFARYDLWKRVGPKLVHALHHVGTTGSNAYEATAVHKELVESFVEAARWRQEPPDIIVRSHRHRYLETTLATGTAGGGQTGRAIAVVSPAWQGRTPFTWKIPGARLSLPQFGGLVIRYAHNELFTRAYVQTVQRSSEE